MQLVLIADRRRAALEIADVGAFVGDDQRALELPGVRGVDAEVGGQLHGAANALRHIDKRAVGEDGCVQRREKVVAVGHDRTQVLLDQAGMLLHRFGERAEDNAQLPQLLLERSRHRDAVKDRIHRDAREQLALLERDAQFFIGPQELRVQFIQALQPRLLFGRGIVNDVLIVDGRVVDIGPLRFGLRLLERHPVPECPQPPLKHELGLRLFVRNQADGLFVQSLGDSLFFDRGDKTPLVLLIREIPYGRHVCAHCILPDEKMPIVGTNLPRASLILTT